MKKKRDKTNLKKSGDNNKTLYIIIAVIVILVLAFLVYNYFFDNRDVRLEPETSNDAKAVDTSTTTGTTDTRDDCDLGAEVGVDSNLYKTYACFRNGSSTGLTDGETDCQIAMGKITDLYRCPTKDGDPLADLCCEYYTCGETPAYCNDNREYSRKRLGGTTLDESEGKYVCNGNKIYKCYPKEFTDLNGNKRACIIGKEIQNCSDYSTCEIYENGIGCILKT